MFLTPDDDELQIAGAAADYLADAVPIARLHTSDAADLLPDLRRQIGEMGWFGLALPEAHGGSGLSAVEHALFFREVGRQCGPIEILAQTLALRLALPDALRQDMMSGEAGVALAIPDTGRLRILGGVDCSYALIASPSEAGLIAIDPSGERRPSLDPAGSMRLIAATPAAIGATMGSDTWQMGALGVAAMLLGIAETALDMIVNYAKVRETFGRKIGSYQAVRHPCADMALRAEAARCQLWYAAASIKEDRPDAATHVAAAKHLANQAALANADTNIQLHGGIGVTDEHDAHLLLKHAMVLAKLFGSKRVLLSRLLHAKAV